MADEIPDEELMLRYGRGNTGAFDVLYQRHKGPLYRYTLHQCGQEHVDELFQDIWLKVIVSRKRYKANALFKTWLYHIARNRIIDHYRRQNIRPSDNNSDMLASAQSTRHLQPEIQLETAKQHELLMQAISGLPQDQKETFLLKESTGLGIDQVAQITGVTYETAKSRLRYAVKKLRERLEIIHEH